MQANQIAIVQQSFAKVRPIAAQAAELFYQRLFTLDPALRDLFTGDMRKQGQMLMQMIGAAVGGLSNVEKLAPTVRALGARHVGYGVKDSHYLTVGAALLWTLEQGLGDDFTPEVREAWGAAYELMSTVMQLGAMDVQAQLAA